MSVLRGFKSGSPKNKHLPMTPTHRKCQLMEGTLLAVVIINSALRRVQGPCQPTLSERQACTCSCPLKVITVEFMALFSQWDSTITVPKVLVSALDMQQGPWGEHSS